MAGGFRNLLVYKKAFALALEIFEITKGFPKRGNVLTDFTNQKIITVSLL